MREIAAAIVVFGGAVCFGLAGLSDGPRGADAQGVGVMLMLGGGIPLAREFYLGWRSVARRDETD